MSNHWKYLGTIVQRSKLPISIPCSDFRLRLNFTKDMQGVNSDSAQTERHSYHICQNSELMISTDIEGSIGHKAQMFPLDFNKPNVANTIACMATQLLYLTYIV
jgi:hypothetical protein